MQTEVMKLEDINPAPYNPRVELQPGDAQYEALKNSLGRFGLVEPLVVNRKTGNLISGHQRLNVLKAQGIEEAEVIVADLDEETEKAANIAMNKIEGEWDYDKLDEIFEGMDREELKFTGFEPGEVASMYEEALEEEAETPKQGGGGNGGGEGDAEEPPFRIYMSFPSKEKAQAWLNQRGIPKEFEKTRAVVVKMKGDEYDRECD